MLSLLSSIFLERMAWVLGTSIPASWIIVVIKHPFPHTQQSQADEGNIQHIQTIEKARYWKEQIDDQPLPRAGRRKEGPVQSGSLCLGMWVPTHWHLGAERADIRSEFSFSFSKLICNSISISKMTKEQPPVIWYYATSGAISVKLCFLKRPPSYACVGSSWLFTFVLVGLQGF